MIPTVEIIKGGFLLSDREGRKPSTDVTDGLISFLLYSCSLQEGVTLKDILILANKHREKLGLIIGNWFEELLDEALAPIEQGETDKTYLYLQIEWDLIQELNYLSGHAYPETFLYTEKEKYSIGMSSCVKWLDVPVKLSQECKFTRYDLRNDPEVSLLKEVPYTLLNVLQSIFWGLTESGSPKMRDEFAKELDRRIASIDTAQTFSWEEVKARITENLKSIKDKKSHP